jgi:hypothetical protein
MSVSIDDCQLFLSDGALLTAVLWLNKLKEKTSGILCLRVLRTNLPGSTVIENSNYFTYPVVQHHPSAVIPGMGLRSNHENILVHHLGNPHALSHSQTENLGTFDSRLETNADGLIVNSSQPWKLKTQTKPAVVEFSNNPEDDIEESSDIQGTLTGFEIGLPSHSVRHISQISQTPRPTLRMTQHNMMSNKNVNGQHLLETKQLDLQSQRGRISQTTSRPDQLSIRNSSFWRSSSDGDVPTKTFRVASAKSMKVEEQESEAGQQRHMARDGQIRSYTAPIVAPLDEGDAAVSQQPAGSNDVDILADKKAGVTSRMNGIKMAQNKKQGENETNGPKEKAKDDEVEQKAKKLEEDLAEQWSSAGIGGSDEESDSDAITELQQSKV